MYVYLLLNCIYFCRFIVTYFKTVIVSLFQTWIIMKAWREALTKLYYFEFQEVVSRVPVGRVKCVLSGTIIYYQSANSATWLEFMWLGIHWAVLWSHLLQLNCQLFIRTFELVVKITSSLYLHCTWSRVSYLVY